MADNFETEYSFTVDPEESKSEFVRSVEEYIPEKTSKKKKKSKKLVSKIIYAFIMLLCLAVLAWGISTIVMSTAGYSEGEKLYTNLADYFNSENTEILPVTGDKYIVRYSSPGVSSPASLSLSDIRSMTLENIEINVSDTNPEAAQYRAKFEALKQINPDIYGWITIDDSEVDYPIVRGKDNVYYLDHAYTGEYMIVGSIFADYRTNDSIMANYNTVLYGHNMENGSMFNIVEQMTEDEELFDTARIEVCTPDGIYIYAPVSVYETNAYDQYFRMRFANVKEFTDFADSLLEKSVYKRTAEFTETDRILTLSTCTNEAFSGRYAMHARLIDVEVFE